MEKRKKDKPFLCGWVEGYDQCPNASHCDKTYEHCTLKELFNGFHPMKQVNKKKDPSICCWVEEQCHNASYCDKSYEHCMFKEFFGGFAPRDDVDKQRIKELEKQLDMCNRQVGMRNRQIREMNDIILSLIDERDRLQMSHDILVRLCKTHG